MADNTAQTGTATIATDEITTLNGTATAAVHAQRIKVGYGDEGAFQDVTTAFPLPVSDFDGIVTGTITANDASAVGTHGGLGVPLTGTPTANSYVAYKMHGGESAFSIRLAGTFNNGTVWVESSPDSTNGIDGGWTTNLVRQSGIDVTFIDASLTTAGIFRGVSAGYSYLRLRITGATAAPSVTATLRVSAGTGVTALVASLPAGGNQIGTVSNLSTAVTGVASGNINSTYLTGTAAQTTNATLVNAPATGLSIYVTDMEGSNEGTTATRMSFLEGSTTTAKYARFMAASGGGFVTNLRTPWKLPPNTALSYRVGTATTWHTTVNYYIAP